MTISVPENTHLYNGNGIFYGHFVLCASPQVIKVVDHIIYGQV